MNNLSLLIIVYDSFYCGELVLLLLLYQIPVASISILMAVEMVVKQISRNVSIVGVNGMGEKEKKYN